MYDATLVTVLPQASKLPSGMSTRGGLGGGGLGGLGGGLGGKGGLGGGGLGGAYAGSTQSCVH